ncbi:hypothetical protein EVAR_11075_1 [Eumeta japonica]|uniref:Uncharacterized protein n=1 Tax=Eumeta variegata TaxID=151549 RepID=A0A4C1U4Z5_EUMVA|nr:hypothetical protein EVAR_11075_1 [Eumeta japonica]
MHRVKQTKHQGTQNSQIFGMFLYVKFPLWAPGGVAVDTHRGRGPAGAPRPVRARVTTANRRLSGQKYELRDGICSLSPRGGDQSSAYFFRISKQRVRFPHRRLAKYGFIIA